MPDMQTALKEAIKDWGESAGRHQVQPQTTLPEESKMQTAKPDTQEYVPAATQYHGDGMRSIFAFIKTHPDCAISDLKSAGFAEGTTASAIHRLYVAGKVTRTVHKEVRDAGHGPILRNVYRYRTAVNEFHDRASVVPNPLTTKKIVLHKKKQAAQPAQGIAALPTKMVEVKTKEQEQREYIAMVDAQAKPIPANITAEYVIKHISLSEAVVLHAELKKMLG